MIPDVVIPFAKILRPSAEEFASFEDFVESIDTAKDAHEIGAVKVIPPAKWKPRKTDVTTAFDHLTVQAPIEQNVQGKSGVYELLLIPKKSMKLNDYRKKVECFDHNTDDKPVEEVEETFWKSIAFSPPLYGADMMGTLFDEGVAWNLGELPGVLSAGLKNPIKGINNPYLYIGSWKTMFGWHKEDLDLYSINFNHYGKPKFWYCMPPSEGEKLEKFARSYFPDAYNKCHEFIRHKTLMINPYVLKQKIPDLKIYKVCQNPGEYVLTAGGAYHAGFNWGFNIAEAVNYATLKWLEILPHVDSCKCISDTVKIDKTQFYINIMSDPKYNKIPYVRKLCLENGAEKVKGDKHEEDAESVETTDSRGGQSGKRGRKRDSIEKEKFSSSGTRKSSRARHAPKHADSDEELVQSKLLDKSKKIKKIIKAVKEPKKPVVEEEKKTIKTKSGRVIVVPSRSDFNQNSYKGLGSKKNQAMLVEEAK